jgi:hypothetical protein
VIVQRTKTALLLSIWLLVPGLAAGQSALTPPATVGQRTQMYEDIEVLRRLLNGKLQSQYAPARQLASAWLRNNCSSCHTNAQAGTYGNDSWMLYHHTLRPADFTTTWSNNVNQHWLQSGVFGLGDPNRGKYWLQQELPNTLNANQNLLRYTQLDSGFVEAHPLDTQGVYLKGQGVVYTLTLPLPQAKPKADAAKAPPRPASDWDRVRREVRNEKPEPEKKETPRKEPTLADILLQVLLENGHHFTQLGDNDSLSIVVTFPANGQAPVNAPNTPRVDATFLAPNAPAPSSPDNSGQDYELLGDLHLKQGKAADAEKAYQQAIAQSTSTRRTAALRGKYAQALLSEGKTEEAAHILNQSLAEMKKEQAVPPQPSQPAAAARPALPAKLIVSASKKLLEQAAGSKMSLEDFQKMATVEYLNFTPPQP